MSTIFLVLGTTGEYNDRSEWVVGAFYDEEQANGRVGELRAEIVRVIDALGGERPRYVKDGLAYAVGSATDVGVPSTLSVLDPGFQCDYTGTDYSVEPCELYGAVDTFLSTRAIEVKR